MKKILSFILFVVFIVQSFITVTATNEVSDVEITESMRFLQAFNIMHVEKDSPDDAVTRENFALYIARMLKIDEFAAADKSYFIDLDMSGYTTSVINALSELGIIAQGEDKKFRPNDLITGNEALKMVLCALGYGEYCEASGGFPLGYTRAAAKLDVPVYGESITVGEAAELIFEAMQTPLYMVAGISEDGIRYSDDENQTILSTYWNIFFGEGTVDAAYTGTLGYGGLSDEGHISINQKKYELPVDFVADKYLASYIKFFYTKDNEVIVYIVEEGQKDDMHINIEDFVAIDGNLITYYDDTYKTKSIGAEALNIIYNGMPLDSDIDETFRNLNKGIITLKDSDDNGKFDTLLIDDYSTFIVSAIDTKAEKIYNDLSSTDVISCNDYSNVRITTSDGIIGDFSIIEKNSVISVAKSKKNDVLRLLIADNSKTGVLTQTKSIDSELRLCIDDNWYRVDKQYAKAYNTMLTAGLLFDQKYTFVTDMFGDIVYLSLGEESTGELGYVIGITEEGVFDKEVKVKILASDGLIKVFRIYDKVEIDGTTYKEVDRDKVARVMADAKGNTAQLVRYIEEDGQIKIIDTQKFIAGLENENNTLTATFGDTDTQRWYTINRLGIKGVTDVNTIAFCVPFDPSSARDEDYRVCASSQAVTNNGSYYADTYRLYTDPGIAKAMVVRYDPGTTFKNYKYNQKTFLVDEVSAALNDDGDVVTLVRGYENGTEVTFEADPAISFDGVEKGDLIQFSYDVHGNPIKSDANDRGFIMLYDRSVGGMPDASVWSGMVDGRTLYALSTNASQEYYSADFQLSFGYVSNVKNGVVAWGWTDPQVISEYANCSGIPVIVVEDTGKEIEVYKGTVDDVQGYKSAGANCSRVIYHAYTNTGRALYVYK